MGNRRGERVASSVPPCGIQRGYGNADRCARLSLKLFFSSEISNGIRRRFVAGR